jgi:hypothetical protein
MKRIGIVALATLWLLVLQACVTTPPPPPSGPLARVSDTAEGGGTSGGTFYFLAEVDGERTFTDALRASLGASRGQGAHMTLQRVSRPVAAGRRELKLEARHAYAAPIQGLFQRSGPEPLEGKLSVELEEGKHYRVAGRLDAMRSELWLEEADTGRVVGAKIVAQPSARSAAEAADTARAMAGADFTCCNLRYEGDWISDANFVGLPFVPAGARIVVKDFGRHRAHVLIDGRPMRIGLDYGRAQQTVEQYLPKLMVKTDPRLALAGYEPRVQAAIRAGKVLPGMTREQALMALGPPRSDETASLDAPAWSYWIHQGDAYVLEWGPDGRLKAVQASPAVRSLVEYSD